MKLQRNAKQRMPRALSDRPMYLAEWRPREDWPSRKWKPVLLVEQYAAIPTCGQRAARTECDLLELQENAVIASVDFNGIAGGVKGRRIRQIGVVNAPSLALGTVAAQDCALHLRVHRISLFRGSESIHGWC